MRRSLSHGLVVPFALLALAACGDDTVVGSDVSTAATADTVATSTTVPAPAEVLRYVTTGGCEVLGPNCPTWSVWDDGTVQVWRTAVGGEPEITGTIPVATVAAWQAVAADIDLTALRDEVGQGSCNSCVDGADIVVTVHRADGELVLDSTDLAFDPEHEVFAALEALMIAARGVGELPLEDAG
ncbi:MAG: hypothetical protein RL238_2712 [Actinomycetota bacterium]|jgi:hypothetical protein